MKNVVNADFRFAGRAWCACFHSPTAAILKPAPTALQQATMTTVVLDRPHSITKEFEPTRHSVSSYVL